MKLTTSISLLILALIPSAGVAQPTGGTPSNPASHQRPAAASSVEIEAKLEKIMREKGNRELGYLEKDLIRQITTLHEQGRLKPVLFEIAQRALDAGKLPPRITAANLQEYIDRLDNMIGAELKAHGRTKGFEKTSYRSWEELSREQLAKVRTVGAAGRHQPGVKENRFRTDMEKLAATRFVPVKNVQPLINGSASFPVRQSLIEGARKKIHVMSWAFEDDHTGDVFSKLLIKRFREGIDVKVMVDRKTAELTGYHRILETMERAGVPLIRWTNPKRDYYGFHRKMLIIDDTDVIAGGMNFGDVYSHMGEEQTPKWRDTDVLVQGEAVKYAEKVFSGVWNEQVRTRKLTLPVIDTSKITVQVAAGTQSSVAIINHVPNPEGQDSIMLAVLKAIECARTTIDIANAYYISTPALEEALIAAKARGVKVRLFTNSAESVDVPVISKPIVNSLPPLLDKGVEVYIKTGATLHSKVMVVDDHASFVMSYNHHPQSLRTQGEIAFLVLDDGLAGKLTAAYENDIQGARRVRSRDEVKMENDALDFMVTRYFFDQL